ncbi:hypothetical protein XENOCAPTIV_006382 [Xenoophorus captivus]|uniref:Uncharacterized protein n=1 Tax=Xenoophorus captivus TaxID=1517983 RepID=A0ABV0SDZ2_9TELE
MGYKYFCEVLHVCYSTSCAESFALLFILKKKNNEGSLFFSPLFQNKQLLRYHYFSHKSEIPNTPNQSWPAPAPSYAYCYKPKTSSYVLFSPNLIGAHNVTAMSPAQCQDARTMTGTEQWWRRGCKHNTCEKAPAKVKIIKTELNLNKKKNCELKVLFYLRTGRIFLPQAAKFLM